MILSISDVSELKKEVTKRFAIKVHFCDSCGGQSFKIENPTEEVIHFITLFFAEKNLKAVFSENGEYFIVKKDS